MRAIVLPAATSHLEDLVVADVPVPEPGPGDVRFRVEAVSLNPADWKFAIDHKPGWRYPHAIGLDGAGTVDAVGAGVTAWQPGDRVVVHGNFLRPGVFADYAVAAAHALSRVPGTVAWTDAAALPCAGYTAYQGLFRKAHLAAGQTIVVQGANGGVGGFATQLAHQGGARVIGLAKPEHHAAVRRLGADVVLDYRDPDLLAKVRAETPGGYGADVLLEVANPGDARTSLAFLHYNGHLISIDPLPVMTDVPAYTYAASIHEVGLGGAYAAGHVPTQADFATIGDDMLARLAAGRLDPMIAETIPFDAIPDGLRRLQRREVTGKIVATIGG